MKLPRSNKKGKTVSPREAVKLLTRKLGPCTANGEWVNFNCPFRHEKNGVNKPDTKKRLGVNLRTGWFNCHRCARKGLTASEWGIAIEGAVPTRTGRKERAKASPTGALVPPSAPSPCPPLRRPWPVL